MSRRNTTIYGMTLIAGPESGYISECGLYVFERVGSTRWGVRLTPQGTRDGGLPDEIVCDSLRACRMATGKLWPSAF
jgi:hypothetical protein